MLATLDRNRTIDFKPSQACPLKDASVTSYGHYDVHSSPLVRSLDLRSF